MKKQSLLFLLSLLGLVGMIQAQAPKSIKYQGVARNASGSALNNTALTVRLTIYDVTATGPVLFKETHAVTTNPFGLYNLNIGQGTAITGTFAAINWGSGAKFIEQEVDFGSGFVSMGTSQFLSVPYALYAEVSGTGGATGATGATGAAGVAGPAGPTGAAGTNGATGANGTNGTNGTNGATGATGAAGVAGPAGPTGAAGANGATGAAGTNGTNGTNGATGATGAAGVAGPTGAVGAAGANGATGATGANGVTGPTGPGTLSGTTNYVIKFTSATGGGNSTIQDNGTSISAGLITPAIAYQMYVYRQQLTVNGDGQCSLFGYRTRDSQNDGTAYSQIATNRASGGFNFWGDVYTFGDASHNYNDYSRCGGSLGAEVSGTYWGSLGYRSSGLLNYGVYGSGAYASGAGLVPTAEANGIGGGFFGTFGTLSKGSVIGHINSGELFAAYNIGDVYTSGKNIEMVASGEEMIPAFGNTSTEATVYKKGKIQLVNGTATIEFDAAYAKLLGEEPIVTVSAMGECNGVYVTAVTKTGFTVKELNNGNSNVQISWISVGNRVDAATTEVPNFVKAKSFDRNLGNVLFNDGNKKQDGEGFWWDGQTIKFGKNYPSSLNLTREQKTQLMLEGK